MFSSSPKEKKQGVIGIIDIGSARVSGAIITDWVKTTNEVSEAVAWQELPEWERFRLGIDQSLKTVLKKMAHGRHKKPEELFVFLSSPFFVGNTKIIKTQNRTAFEISPPYLAGLVKKNCLEFDCGPKDDLVKLENEIMQVKIDGYSVKKPIGQMAHELELAHWQGESHISLIEDFKCLIQAEFPEIKVTFHSFAYSVYAVFSELLPDKDWVLIDTGNELTDVIVIKDGYLAEHISFPLGKNSLVRSVSRDLQTVVAEAESLLNRYASGHLNQKQKTRLELSLSKNEKEWTDSLGEALGRVLQTTILPETVYIFGDEPSDKIFADFAKNTNLSLVSISRKPLKVYYVDKPIHQALRRLTEKSFAPLTNSFLLVEALFCVIIKNSKLNLWPFNQLITTMHDIIKNKKSLREIFPESKVSANSNNPKEDNDVTFKTSSYEPPRNYRQQSGLGTKAKIFAGLLVLAVIIVGGAALSSNFAKITVKVTPKQGRLMVSNNYEASKLGENGLKFILASNIQSEEKVSVPANGTESVKIKARGPIVIYNNTPKDQGLVATTRFQTKDGLIYRTEKAINIPGQTKNSKGETIPGQLEVTVVADQVGSNYNIATADFTIPGFKGTPKFSQFYARSKGAISGGMVGERPKVSETDLAKAQAELEKKLLVSVASKLKPQVEDYVLFDGAVISNFTPEITNNPAKPGEAELTLKADATGILFNKKELASYLAKQQVPDYQDEPVDITNWSSFKFSLINKDSSDINSLNKINFKLDGTGHLVWIFDAEEMKKKLQTSNTSNYKEVFDKNFPMVQVADIIFTPPWIRSIPSDSNKIQVETQISKP